jgi:hypothetical protein
MKGINPLRKAEAGAEAEVKKNNGKVAGRCRTYNVTTLLFRGRELGRVGSAALSSRSLTRTSTCPRASFSRSHP